MTVLEIIDNARKILKDQLPSTRTFPDDSSSFFQDTEMVQWLNWTQYEVQNKLVQTFENWFVTSTSISLVDGTEEYNLPCACLKVVRVEDNEASNAPIELLPISFNDKDKYLYPAEYQYSQHGDVACYAIKGNRFVFRPRPTRSTNNTIKVYYCRRADYINTATACSIIPDEYHELLVWGVVENGMIKQEATAEAMAMVLGRRNRLVADLITTGENRQIQRSRKVKRKKGI